MRELVTWFKWLGVIRGSMQHTGADDDAESGHEDRRRSPAVSTAAETLVVPLGLVLDVATSLSTARR